MEVRIQWGGWGGSTQGRGAAAFPKGTMQFSAYNIGKQLCFINVSNAHSKQSAKTDISAVEQLLGAEGCVDSGACATESTV